MSDEINARAISDLAEQGRELGYAGLDEVVRHPVLAAMGALSERQRKTAAYHLDTMDESERYEVYAALTDFEQNVTATVAGMPLGQRDYPDPERFPYLYGVAFKVGMPRYVNGADDA